MHYLELSSSVFIIWKHCFYMQTIDISRQRDYERFESNRRFEEMTDIAERLSYPIDTTIEYELRGTALYALSDTVDRPFHDQTHRALLAGERQFTGDQAFQRERLRLEHEEALLVDRFASGEFDGNVLIKYSKVPDAVVEGRTSINGYRRDLLRSFVRMYYRTDLGVSCRLFTLDHNHPQGTQQVGELLDIDATQPSEEVLATHTILDVPSDPEYFVEQLMNRAIELYDEAILAETGVRTYAGSRYLDRRDAMGAIAAQSHLVSQHMDAIASIVSRGLGDGALEQERRKTAAAIKLATEGRQITSNADASVTNEVATNEYGGDCALGNSVPEQMGMNQVKTGEQWMTCPFCGQATYGDPCASRLVCNVCAAEVRDGRVVSEGISKQGVGQSKVRRAISSVQPIGSSLSPQGQNKRDIIKQQYGDHAVIKTEKAIGDERHYVIHKISKAVIAQLN